MKNKKIITKKESNSKAMLKNYAKIISKVKNKRYFIELHDKHFKGKIELLDLVEKIDALIEGTGIIDKELKFINGMLKTRLVSKQYTVDDILTEVNLILNNNFFSDAKSYNPKNKKATHQTNTPNGYNYNYKNPKKKTPKDLEKYRDMVVMKKEILNAVGTKR